MKKAIFGIFICLSAVFLMSHNVGALNNQLLGDDWYLYRHTSGNPMCAMNTFDVNARRQSVGDNPWYLDAGVFAYFSCADSNNSAVSAQQGDIIVVELNTNKPLSPYWYNTSARYLFSAMSGDIQTIYYYTDGFSSSVEFGWTFNPEGDVYRATFRIQSINFYRHNNAPPSYETALNNIQSSLGTVNNNLNNINDSVEDLNDTITDRNEAEDEALDNISDQTPSDISSEGETENQATTNLIGLFSSFISALSNITQAQNCNLTLNFPSYAGGSINVNVCQYKDKAGNLISVFSSLTLIVFYIPLALKLLSMIYNEIRSFTNG